MQRNYSQGGINQPIKYKSTDPSQLFTLKQTIDQCKNSQQKEGVINKHAYVASFTKSNCLQVHVLTLFFVYFLCATNQFKL